MKMNKNLSSSLLLSLLCLSSCLFAPVSSAAELNVADLQEEIASTKLVRSIKPEGLFGRVRLGVTDIKSTETGFGGKKDASPFAGISLGVGKYLLQPTQNLHVGVGVDLASFQPTLSDSASMKSKLTGYVTALYTINSSVGVQAELNLGGACLNSQTSWFSNFSPVGGGSFKVSYRMLNKVMISAGYLHERTFPLLPVQMKDQINELNNGFSVTIAYLFDAVTTEELVVE